jgi:alkylmercury lyase
MPPDANRAFRQDWRRLVLRRLRVRTDGLALGEIMAATGEQVSAILKPNQYWAALRPYLPSFSVAEQRAAVALYRELAKGEPVDDAQLARTLGLSIIETRAFLERETIKCLVYADDQGRVLGFGGLAATAMHHRFEVDGRRLSTWCAWDSLFIPEILGRPAHVSSVDPESAEIVRLVVTPERIESVQPNGTLISFIRPDAHIFGRSAANVMAKFCHFIFFFASRSSGERWVDKNPGTFLYSLDDAFALAKRFNANNFGFELAR